jgi:hypothetical protein
MPKIDYRLRPSKAIQRHMIVEICRRLTVFAPLPDYQYVGFGSLEFIDFDLVHRSLGITDMTSIEADLVWMERYLFNRPFQTVKIIPGRASEHLTELDWGKLSIVWLDYEQKLNNEVISDVTLLCGRLQPGSALFVTVNAQPEMVIAERRPDLVKRIGERRIPPLVTNESLAKWGLADTQHQVLHDVISDTLRDRFIRADWMQVLDIRYADDARMQTLGGIVLAPGNKKAFDDARFGDLDFVRFAGGAPLQIRVPVLTAKERRALNEQLPLSSGATLTVSWLSDDDANDYLRVYRYAPT